MEKIDVKLKDLSDNESKIIDLNVTNDKIEKTILNNNDTNKGLNIDNNQIKLFKNSNDDCQQTDGLQLDRIMEKNVNIQTNIKRPITYKKKTLFKKFKSL